MTDHCCVQFTGCPWFTSISSQCFFVLYPLAQKLSFTWFCSDNCREREREGKEREREEEGRTEGKKDPCVCSAGLCSKGAPLCGGQKTLLGIAPQAPSFCPSFSFEVRSSMTWGLTRRLSSFHRAPGICLYLPSWCWDYKQVSLNN